MIDQIDDRLAAWVEETLGGITPTHTEPTADNGKGELGVNLYLLELVNEPLRHHTQRPYLQPALRYLVTTSAGEPRNAHRLLGELLFAALENADFEVELEPASAQLWSAFHLPPRPSFIVRIPLPRERTAVTAPLVRQAADTQEVATTIFYGLLVGPGATPLAGARIELPALYRSARTDAQGRFQFVGVPVAPYAKHFRIITRGHELEIDFTETGSATEPVVITIDL
ncbi:MAG: hypothetical protein R3C14_55075 [Caldilineaceae bacterium]